MEATFRKIKKFNLHLLGETDDLGIPLMQAVDYVPDKLVGFNQVLTGSGQKACVHFFLDDHQFERVWASLELNGNRLSKYEACFSPDFSLYTNYPKIVQMFNVYRNMLVGQYFQSIGITCVPTASWSDERSYGFCFNGLPKHSTIAISTTGVVRNKEATELFRAGVKQLIKVKRPTRLLVYGSPVDADYGGVEVIQYDNEQSKRMHQARKEKRR